MEISQEIALELQLKTNLQTILQKFSENYSPMLQGDDYKKNMGIMINVLNRLLEDIEGMYEEML